MDLSIKEHATAKSTWIKGLFIILFAIFYNIAELVLGVVVILQFLTVLFTGKENSRLLTFGQSLSTFIYQVMRFITFNSEEKPFPFNPWPDGPTADENTPEPVSSASQKTKLKKTRPKKAPTKKTPAAASDGPKDEKTTTATSEGPTVENPTAVVSEEPKTEEGHTDETQSKNTPRED